MDSNDRMPTVQRRPVRAAAIAYPLGLWPVMAVVAVANGIFREVAIVPRVGEYPGHVVSTALLVTAILVLSAGYFAYTSIDFTRSELLLVGTTWTVLTVGFEFLVGYLEGVPPGETIAQYDVLAGQVWIVVPVSLFVAPLLFGTYLGE